MSPSKKLLKEIEAHLRASGESPTAFGLRVKSNKSFVHDLRKGRGMTVDTFEQVSRAIAPKKPKARRARK